MTIAAAVAAARISDFDELIAGREEPLVVADLGALRVLLLNNPRKKNALSVAMRQALNVELQRATTAPAVRVLAIAGAEHTFCSGLDHTEPQAQVRSAVEPNPGDAVRACAKPIIAAVDGVCMTGGLELALAASFIVATERAPGSPTPTPGLASRRHGA